MKTVKQLNSRINNNPTISSVNINVLKEKEIVLLQSERMLT